MVEKVKFTKDNLGAFMDGLDYSEPRDQYEEGWHAAIGCIREHMNHEMR